MTTKPNAVITSCVANMFNKLHKFQIPIRPSLKILLCAYNISYIIYNIRPTQLIFFPPFSPTDLPIVIALRPK